MFSVYKTLHPPTAVDNAVYCNFINSQDRNLITASVNRLQVYRLNTEYSGENNKSSKVKFECIETYNLFGTISAIASCRYGSMTKDALIIAFDDAKLSIVEYDSFTGDLTTLSIHYFENELDAEGAHFNIYHPVLRVDPNMRCAVMLVYGCKLVVIPFHDEHHSQLNQQVSSSGPVDLAQMISADVAMPKQMKLEPSINESIPNTGKTFISTSLSSYTVDLSKLENWVSMRIIDLEFLYGYLEPTLYVLSEATRTWVGRYAVKKDTCNSVCLSLNLTARSQPIIWNVDKLPSDCLRCVAVPPPIGGVLLFAVNSLIYTNQSVPSYGVSLNSIAKTSSQYPFKSMDHLKITLDCSHAVFIAPDRLIVSLKAGEIYIVTMLTDTESLRTVRSFQVEKGPGSVLSSCLTRCFENYLFIGSRLGNSVLLKYNKKPTVKSEIGVANGLAALKRKKALSYSENNSTDGNVTESGDQDMRPIYNDKDERIKSAAEIDDEDDLLYDLDQMIETGTQRFEEDPFFSVTTTSDQTVAGTAVGDPTPNSGSSSSYSFEICDILLNIAPCGQSIIGETASGDYTEFDATAAALAAATNGSVTSNGEGGNNGSTTRQYHIDLITSSGHSKNGAISVLQRSLRPEVIATFQISDIIDMWSVFSSGDILNEDGITYSTPASTYLFLSRDESTMILQMANEITELDKEASVFCTKLPTMACANLSDNKYILQITSTSMYIYSEVLTTVLTEATNNHGGSDNSDNDNKSKSPPHSPVLTTTTTSTTKLLFTVDLLPKIMFEQTQTFSKIKAAQIVDPYTAILTEEGSLSLYVFDKTTESLLEVQPLLSSLINLTSISCFSLYKDESGLMSTQLVATPTEDPIKKPLVSNYQSDQEMAPTSSSDSELTEQDDEDELLYGNSNKKIEIDFKPSHKKAKTSPNRNLNGSSVYGNSNATSGENHQSSAEKAKIITYWLTTVSLDGVMSLFSIQGSTQEPGIVLTHTVTKFNTAPRTLVFNNCQSTQFNTQLSNNVAPAPIRCESVLDNTSVTNAQVHEILMLGVGFEKSRVFLIARIEEDLIMYEGFTTTIQPKTESNSFFSSTSISPQLNFKRISHEIIICDRRRRKMQKMRRMNKDYNTLHNNQTSNGSRHPSNLNDYQGTEFTTLRTKHVPALRSFSNIVGFSGFCVTGTHPFVVFVCARSGITAHPLWIDGPLLSFTPLKNASITLCGFIYLSKNWDIRVCTLPSEDCNGKLQVYYDSAWILRKIQLRHTVHFICYHEESKTYAVVTSQSEATNKLMQLGGEDKEMEEHQRDSNFILPQREQFFLQLYTPISWESLPLGKFTFTEWEHVSCLKTIRLPYQGHESGYRAYLAVSSINVYTEDVNSRGKIIIFDVIETVPEPGKPLTGIKIKIILEKEQKGPVSCLESVDGYLVGGVGQKIFIWEYNNEELIGKAFIDVHFFVHKMVTLKSFVLIADLERSISLIRFQKEYTKLSVVAKDKRMIETYSCDYLVDNTNLAFISSDSEKNLCVFMYQNESHDSLGGQWLVRKAEFNLGSQVNSMFRLKCRVNDPTLDKRSSLAVKRQVTYCTTLDGSIGFLIPVSEKTFRRLFMLQNATFIMKQHYAGLNPKSYRMYKSKSKELSNPQRNILDGDLLFEYFNLSYIDRNDIAKKIKTSSDQLLDDLAEIFQLTTHF